MTHIPWEIFQIVLDYIYSGKDALLRQVRGFPNLKKYLDFVLGVLAVADELMLDKLSIACQKVIGLYGKYYVSEFIVLHHNTRY